MTSTIRRATATPVSVPAKPDSLHSPGVEDADAEFARRYYMGSTWTAFPLEVKWIVEIEDEAGRTGIGETYRGAAREQVEQALGAVVGRDIFRLNWRYLPVDGIRVYDAIESAVLDLAGQAADLPVYQLLGGAVRDRVECSGWTGRRTAEDAARKAHEAMLRGHRVFKFKCASDDNVRAWTEAIHKRCGGGIRVLLDPNQRWNDVATALRLMEGVRAETMFALEDPIRRTDLDGFRELRRRLGIPVYLHIVLPYDQRPSEMLDALSLDAVNGFNFNGSMFRFVELAATAAFAGLPCWHGSEVDLGILEASALHACAAAPGCILPSDIFGELVREDDLIESPILFSQGHAAVPRGAGLGVRLDRSALARYQAGEPVRL
ncbi:MAG: muconate lactonizing mandelate racemase [Bryobacterales bacterium]|nr:muconate lactonizing mandelate racemase [Bryobacterales bacterium]